MLQADTRQRPPLEPTAHARAASVYIRAFHGMKRDRGFAHAAMCEYHTPRPINVDPIPIEPPDRTSFVDIAALAAWGPQHQTTPDEYLALHLLESVLNSSVISWLDRIITEEYVEERIRFAAERLLVDTAP